MEVLCCRNRDFQLFCSCDLEFELMIFIYKLDPYSLEIYPVCKYELLHTSGLSKSSGLSKVIL